MNNAPADPLSWYYDIPIVTRVYLTGAFMTTVSEIVSDKRYPYSFQVLFVFLEART